MFFLENEKKYSPHTLISYKKDAEQFINFVSQQYECSLIEEINLEALRAWISDLKLKGLKTSSVNRKIATLKSYFTFLFDSGFITKNHGIFLTTQREERFVPSFLKQREIDQIAQGLDELSWIKTTDKLIFLTLLTTGIRSNELMNIKVQDIDHEKCVIHIRKGKGGDERLAILTNSLSLRLKNFVDDMEYMPESYLFQTQTHKKLYSMYVYRAVNKILSHFSHVVKKSPHTLRHTLATSLIMKGADIMSVKEILGHRSINAVQRYTHVNIYQLQETFKKSHPKSK